MYNLTKLASAMAVAASLAFSASSVNAAPFIEDFDPTAAGGSPVTSFISGLFTVTFEAAGDGGDLLDSPFGEGGTNGIEALSGAPDLGTTEEISIMLTAGGSFIWHSLYVDDFFGSGAPTDLIGMLGAATVYTTTVPDLSFGTFGTGGVEVDTVLIQSADFNFLIFDTLAGETIDAPPPPPTGVPAPGTLALFGLGLAGLGYARRRKVA
jgi:hypothetical protein